MTARRMWCSHCGAELSKDGEGIPAHRAPVCGPFMAEGDTYETGRCLDCGATYRIGDGYGDEQLFCSETCADAYRHELGA